MARRIIGILALSAALLFSGYIALYLVIQSQVFQRWLTVRISETTGYIVKMDDLRFAAPLRFIASTVTVSASHGPILTAAEVVLTLRPLDLVANTIHRIQLRQPTFYFELDQVGYFFSGNTQTVAVRHLVVENGTIVFKTGTARTVDVQSVSLNAHDVNLGQTTGIRLRAELPSLAASADISIHADADQGQAEILLDQRAGRAVPAPPSAGRQAPGVLSTAVTLRKNGQQQLVASATGELNQFTLADEYVSGRFEIESEIDAAFENGAFAGTFAIYDTSIKAGATRPVTPKEPATATIAGSYSLTDKSVHIKALRLESAWGTGDATTTLGFVPALNLANGLAKLRNVPAGIVAKFLPGGLGNLTVKGVVESELAFGGTWPNIALKGIALTQGVQLKHADWSAAQVSIKAPFEWSTEVVRARDVQIQARSVSATRQDHTTFGAEEISATTTLEKSAKDALRIAANVTLLRGRFASTDGSKLGENIGVTGRFETIFPGEKEVTSVAAKVEVQQGELLWDSFFGDLSARGAALETNLEYRSPADAILLRRLQLSSAGIGTLQVTGTIERVSGAPVVALEVHSDNFAPGGVFDFFIRDTLKFRYPMLERLNVGGKLDFTTRLEGAGDQWQAQGYLRMRGGDIGEKSGNWQIGPFELALPFKIHFPRAATAIPNGAPAGTLAIASARFGSESVPPIKTTVSAWNNTLVFHQVPLAIYGGTVEISNLRWNDVLTNPQDVAFTLSAKGLQLQPLTKHLGWHPFGGTINAAIPTVESTGALLRTRGEIEVDVFGGKVRIAPVEIQNPFSRLFSIRLNTGFEEINLELASESFEFGRISGILEGTVNDLVITNGEPAQFTANIHTVPKSGVGQWISVEALNKITVLSSGNDAGALYGGLAGFFENFRYSRLGFRATLKNDRLRLRGIESRDGKEYLVVGTLLPPTVNIISHTQEIGFGELVRRLERIGASGRPEIQ